MSLRSVLRLVPQDTIEFWSPLLEKSLRPAFCARLIQVGSVNMSGALPEFQVSPNSYQELVAMAFVFPIFVSTVGTIRQYYTLCSTGKCDRKSIAAAVSLSTTS